MKKLYFKTLVGFIIFFFAASASAQSIFYVKGAIGPAWQSNSGFLGEDIEYDPSGVGTLLLALGISIGPQFSAEIEFSSRSNDIDNVSGIPYEGDLDSSAFMINGIYKLPLQNGYAFFAGAGFGVVGAELYVVDYDPDADEYFENFADGSAFATQFMIGMEAEINDNLTFSLEYKKINAMDLELNGTEGVFQNNFGFRNGSVLAGLIYKFY